MSKKTLSQTLEMVSGTGRAYRTMVLRSRGFWIGCILAILLCLLSAQRGVIYLEADKAVDLPIWAVTNTALLLPLVAVVVGGGAFSVDRRLGTFELLGATRASHRIRLAGSLLGFLGPVLAAGILTVLAMSILILWMVGPEATWNAFLGGTLILLPALTAATSVTCLVSTVLPPRIVQFLLLIGWIWASLNGVTWSVSHTLLDPGGAYARKVVFDTDALMQTAPFHPEANPLTLGLNLGITVLGWAALCLLLGPVLLQCKERI